MAAGEREQVLADFQACTQLEDIETCIAVLDQHDWNLMKAVQSVMSDGQTCSPTAGEPMVTPLFPRPPGDDFYSSGIFSDPIPWRTEANVSDSASGFDPGSASGPGPGPSSGFAMGVTGYGIGGRLLNFRVEYRNRNVNIVVPDSETVVKIKELLCADLSIPVSRMELKGWNRKVSDSMVLRDLHLPKENTLFLLTPDEPVSGPSTVSDATSSMELLNRTYQLDITIRDGNKYNQVKLNFEGTKTVKEIKTDVYSVSDIPVRHQIWSGWPEIAKDESMTIGSCGLTYPIHCMEVNRSNLGVSPKPAIADMEIDISDDEDVPESFPSYDDSELFSQDDVSSRRKLQPLMPESVNDEMDALEHFTREFRERYGECNPVFYVGALDNAIKDSLLCPAKERKQLAIYLHHDGSILSNVFCSQTLCNEGVVNYLTNNFIIWAWDMTLETNGARLITLATRHFGSVAATQIRGYKADNLPVLLIISRSRATNEVADVIRGDVTVDELMSRLIQGHEVFMEQQQKDVLEEAERDARSEIRNQQDAAYQESLAVDKRKEEARVKELETKEAEELNERLKKEKEDRQKREEGAIKQAIEESLAKELAPEPSENCTKPLCVLRIRTPKRTMLMRRFYADDKLATVLNFITSEGYHVEEHKLLTTFPRRDLSNEDVNQKLESLKLCPQETLILEERQ